MIHGAAAVDGTAAAPASCPLLLPNCQQLRGHSASQCSSARTRLEHGRGLCQVARVEDVCELAEMQGRRRGVQRPGALRLAVRRLTRPGRLVRRRPGHVWPSHRARRGSAAAPTAAAAARGWCGGEPGPLLLLACQLTVAPQVCRQGRQSTAGKRGAAAHVSGASHGPSTHPVPRPGGCDHMPGGRGGRSAGCSGAGLHAGECCPPHALLGACELPGAIWGTGRLWEAMWARPNWLPDEEVAAWRAGQHTRQACPACSLRIHQLASAAAWQCRCPAKGPPPCSPSTRLSPPRPPAHAGAGPADP